LADDVQINYLPKTDFSKFHSYRWVIIEGNQPNGPDAALDAEIKESVDSQLSAKGLTKTDAEDADLSIDYQTAVDEPKEWNGYGREGGWSFNGMAPATGSTIEVGTLVIDMYERDGKQLVWSGRVSKAVDPGKDSEKSQKELDKSAEKLLKDFPPRQ
jgi:hypothetical protein